MLDFFRTVSSQIVCLLDCLCESLLPSGVQSVDATFKAAGFLAAGVLLDKSAYCVPFLIEIFYLLLLVCLFAGGKKLQMHIFWLCWGYLGVCSPPHHSALNHVLHSNPEYYARNSIPLFLGVKGENVCLTYLVFKKKKEVWSKEKLLFSARFCLLSAPKNILLWVRFRDDLQCQWDSPERVLILRIISLLLLDQIMCSPN